MIEKINIRLTEEGAQTPSKSDERAIGYDLYVSRDTCIHANSRTLVPTGVCVELPIGVEAKIEPRSGFSAKGMEGITTVDYKTGSEARENKRRYNADVLHGKIDPGFIDPMQIIVKSCEPTDFYILKGTRLAQLTFYQTEHPTLQIVEEFDTESRGGGIGHSGTH